MSNTGFVVVESFFGYGVLNHLCWHQHFSAGKTDLDHEAQAQARGFR